MRAIQGAYESLIQGVSQQPAPTRFEGQAEEQINMSSDAVRGLCRRAPTELIGNLMAGEKADWRYSFVSLDDTHEYLVAYRAGQLLAFDVETGNRVNVTNTAPTYITGAECSFVTINSTAYIADSTTVCKMHNNGYVTRRDNFKNWVIGQVLGAAWSRTYKVTVSYKTSVGGVDTWTEFSGSYTTPDGSAASHSAQTKTTYLAEQIVASLNTNCPSDAGGKMFLFVQDQEVFFGGPKSTTIVDVKVKYTDENNNQNIAVYANYCDNPDFIPVRAPKGFVMSILGLGGTDKDDYYLTYMPNDTVLADRNTSVAEFDEGVDPFTEKLEVGVWRECTQPFEPYKFDLTTMPHRLVIADGGGLVFEQCPWEPRGAGDDDSNPIPSFVDKTILDMAAFQGRLVCIAGSAIIMSRTSKPRDFWAKSATVVADSDPIDMESSFKSGLSLQRLALHNRDLVAFSKPAQLTVFGRNSLTPENASIVVSTSFDADLRAAPVSSGSSVFFGVQYGKFSGVREFFTETSSDANNSESITSHCSQYIEGRITQMAASSNFDMLTVTTDEDRKVVYVYQFVTLGKDKAQAAWSKWVLHAEPTFMHFRESELLMVIKMPDKTGSTYQLIKMNLDRVQDDGLDYQVHLDAKSTISSVHNQITIQEPLADKFYFVQGAGCPNPGMPVPIKYNMQNYDPYNMTYVLDMDMNGGTVITGFKYNSSWIPTRPYYKSNNGQPILASRMVIRMFKMRFHESGRFVVEILSEYDAPYEIEFSNRLIGDIHNVIGEEAVYSDFVNIPFRADPEYTQIRIKCSAHTPLNITQLQWAAQLSNRLAR